MKTGLCSITFRQLDIPGIVDLTRDAGLDAIEWGGDVHVPPGDTAAAGKARNLTNAAGLEVSSYGSYYKIIDAEGAEQDFAPVLESALALGTDTVRIWPGAMSSDIMPAALRRKLVGKLRSDLDRAANHGIRLALEFHINSLCDSNSAALAFLEEVDHPKLRTYWQPIYWLADVPYRRAGLEALARRTLNVHVFHWLFHPYRGTWGENVEKLPLAAGEAEWRQYLSVPLSPGRHYALLEFVREDSAEQLQADAAVLRRLVEETGTINS
ncbi:MAG: sugar phosphate isomerase/epimerase family protein [Chthoniobacterales bacterium]